MIRAALSLRGIILPTILMALNSCNMGTTQSQPQPSRANHGSSPAIVFARDSILSAEIILPGELQAYQQVDLYAKMSSFVRQTYVDIGSSVQYNQLLARLDAPEILAQKVAATARWKAQESLYISSKTTYDRLLETSQIPGTVSPNALQIALAQQLSDRAQLQAIEASLHEIQELENYLEIRAPFAGIITARNVSAGAYVGPNGKGSELPVFSLSEQHRLRLVIDVPEKYSVYPAQNDSVMFYLSAFPRQQFYAPISRTGHTLDNRLRAQRLEMDVPNSKALFLPGMIAETRMRIKSPQSSLILPISAILRSTQGAFIIQIKNQRARWIPVFTGLQDSTGHLEIFAEISPQDSIVRDAREEIRDGMLIP